MEKIVLKDISEKEFSKIKGVLSDYISESKERYFEKVKSVLFSAPTGRLIVLDGLNKEDFRDLIVLIDFYNVWKTDNAKNFWDEELEEIYNKLTKKFIRIYKEQPYSDS